MGLRQELDREAATLKLLHYCQSRNWAGIDPYDALNSRIFQAIPLLDSRIPRLVVTQLLKRSPVNLRPLLLVPPTQNPKALALFLSSLIKLRRIGLIDSDEPIRAMAANIAALRSAGTESWCWGYSFAWQTRTNVVPRGTANLVCTTFVANALLDAFEYFNDPRYLEMAESAADFMLRDLYWEGAGTEAGFSYPLPTVRTQVHNANFLASALFCRVAWHSGTSKFIEPALRVTRYSASQQAADGSWQYGQLPTQQWIDNFHTGYNLTGLRQVGLYARTPEFEQSIRIGFEFYRKHFFREDGAAKYFHDNVYPIDAHCVAQSILTLLEFSHLHPGSHDLARSVVDWAMQHMWDPQGFFYYRVLPYTTIKTSYMRWVQAWMLLAMTTWLEAEQARGAQPVAALKVS